jgi:two-component sensor histidine kinase
MATNGGAPGTVGLLSLDDDGAVLAVDEGAEHLLGKAAADLVGRRLGEIVSPGQRVVEITLGGRRFAVLEPPDDAERRLREIEASLHEKEILLKEIHHRVKNNLQVTSSLLRLQSLQLRDENARAMLRDSQDRIRAMALAHEMLYRSRDLSTVDFAEYARSLVAHLSRSYGVRAGQIALRVQIDKVFLGLDVAVPLGLIVNELVTNSFKHAFPNERKGEIMLGLRAPSDTTYELTVADDGVGIPPGHDTNGSLGLQLVHTLTEQLEGHLELQADVGTEFRIAFPRRS